MPKTLKQEILFGVMMVVVMVYGMIAYNVTLSVGHLGPETFLAPLHSLPVMALVAFTIEFLVVGRIASWVTERVAPFDPARPMRTVVVMSVSTVMLMCPIMSLIATVFVNGVTGSEIVSAWGQTWLRNLPMAAVLQLAIAGPLVRAAFGRIMDAYAMRVVA